MKLGAAEPPPSGDGRQAAHDVQDLLFLAADRPILIRLHIRVDGMGFRDAWTKYVENSFRRHDGDGDGVLSSAEIEGYQQTSDARVRGLLAGLFKSSNSRTEAALLDRHTDVVRSVAFSPNGKRLASGSDDETVKLWELPSGRLLATLSGHDDAVRDVAFSPDGRTLASASMDGTVKLWDVKRGELKATLAGHEDYVTAVAFSPERNMLASASFDHSVKLWNTADGTLIATLAGHTEPVWAIAFSPVGKLLASAGEDKTIRLWNLRTAKQKTFFSTPALWDLAFSPDGRLLAACGQNEEISIWDPVTGKRRMDLKGHTGPVRSVSYSADGKQLVSAGWDKTVRLWNVAEGELSKQMQGHVDYVHSAHFSPDGLSIVSAGDDRSLRAWDVASGEERPFLRVGTLNTRQLGKLILQADRGPFRSSTVPSADIVNPATGENQSQATATNQLLANLDTDENGRISASELKEAHQTLRILDWDDDETIELEELFIVEKPYTLAEALDRRNRVYVDPFLELPEQGGATNDLVRTILRKYDRLEPLPADARRSVTMRKPDEVVFPAALFNQHDADGNGQLDADELKLLLPELSPDFEIMIRLGKKEERQLRVDIISAEGQSDEKFIRAMGSENVAIVLGNVELEISADAGDGSEIVENYLEQFQQADVDNNGYLEPGEVEGNPFFGESFAEIDTDDDDKLYERELTIFVTARIEAANSRTILTVLDQGHNLFDILDFNADDRLGRREFGIAIERLRLWDGNGDEQLELNEIPEHFRLAFGRANPGLPGQLPVVQNVSRRRAIQQQLPTGPAWFRKMDRNQDGDVSQREFLGPQSAFEKLDINQDELIAPEEAAITEKQ